MTPSRPRIDSLTGVGDRVLRLIPRVLRDNVRQSDYVFRSGGDEFLVMLSADEDAARAKAAAIQYVRQADRRMYAHKHHL